MKQIKPYEVRRMKQKLRRMRSSVLVSVARHNSNLNKGTAAGGQEGSSKAASKQDCVEGCAGSVMKNISEPKTATGLCENGSEHGGLLSKNNSTLNSKKEGCISEQKPNEIDPKLPPPNAIEHHPVMKTSILSEQDSGTKIIPQTDAQAKNVGCSEDISSEAGSKSGAAVESKSGTVKTGAQPVKGGKGKTHMPQNRRRRMRKDGSGNRLRRKLMKIKGMRSAVIVDLCEQKEVPESTSNQYDCQSQALAENVIGAALESSALTPNIPVTLMEMGKSDIAEKTSPLAMPQNEITKQNSTTATPAKEACNTIEVSDALKLDSIDIPSDGNHAGEDEITKQNSTTKTPTKETPNTTEVPDSLQLEPIDSSDDDFAEEDEIMKPNSTTVTASKEASNTMAASDALQLDPIDTPSDVNPAGEDKITKQNPTTATPTKEASDTTDVSDSFQLEPIDSSDDDFAEEEEITKQNSTTVTAAKEASSTMAVSDALQVAPIGALSDDNPAGEDEITKQNSTTVTPGKEASNTTEVSDALQLDSIDVPSDDKPAGEDEITKRNSTTITPVREASNTTEVSDTLQLDPIDASSDGNPAEEDSITEQNSTTVTPAKEASNTTEVSDALQLESIESSDDDFADEDEITNQNSTMVTPAKEESNTTEVSNALQLDPIDAPSYGNPAGEDEIAKQNSTTVTPAKKASNTTEVSDALQVVPIDASSDGNPAGEDAITKQVSTTVTPAKEASNTTEVSDTLQLESIESSDDDFADEDEITNQNSTMVTPAKEESNTTEVSNALQLDPIDAPSDGNPAGEDEIAKQNSTTVTPAKKASNTTEVSDALPVVPIDASSDGNPAGEDAITKQVSTTVTPAKEASNTTEVSDALQLGPINAPSNGFGSTLHHAGGGEISKQNSKLVTPAKEASNTTEVSVAIQLDPIVGPSNDGPAEEDEITKQKSTAVSAAKEASTTMAVSDAIVVLKKASKTTKVSDVLELDRIDGPSNDARASKRKISKQKSTTVTPAKKASNETKVSDALQQKYEVENINLVASDRSPWRPEVFFRGRPIPRRRILIKEGVHPRAKFEVKRDNPFLLVDTKAALDYVLIELSGEKQIGVWCEVKRAQSKVWFVDISTNDMDFVIDAHALEKELSQLAYLFGNPRIVKVVHRAEETIYHIHHLLGINVANVFDLGLWEEKMKRPKHPRAEKVSLESNILKHFSRRRVLPEGYDLATRPVADDVKHFCVLGSHYLLYWYHRMMFKAKFAKEKFRQECNDPAYIEHAVGVGALRMHHDVRQEACEELNKWRLSQMAAHEEPDDVLRSECLLLLAHLLPQTEPFVLDLTLNSDKVRTCIGDVMRILRRARANAEPRRPRAEARSVADDQSCADFEACFGSDPSRGSVDRTVEDLKKNLGQIRQQSEQVTETKVK